MVAEAMIRQGVSAVSIGMAVSDMIIVETMLNMV